MSIESFINKPYIFDILGRLVYKDLMSKEFYTDLSPNNFGTTLYTREFIFKRDDCNETVDGHNPRFVLFLKAYDFLWNLHNIRFIGELAPRYKMLDALESIHKDGRLFRDPFYNYIYSQYIFNMSKKE